MPLSFRLIETTESPLWDFGWFDLTRFSVEGPREDSTSLAVLEQFLRDPISQRSFCDRGPWGAPVGHHGPFVHAQLSADWFQPIDPRELAERVRAVLDDRQFGAPPARAQREPVDAWLEIARSRAGTAFALEAPDDPRVRVEFHRIWPLFHEFVVLGPEAEELTVAVIGSD